MVVLTLFGESGWPYAFCIMSPRVTVCGKVNPPNNGKAEAKASAKCATKSHAVDPKPGELSLARLKLL